MISGRCESTRPRFYILLLFTSIGALTGFGVGGAEGILLFTVPRASGLLRPDIHYAVLFVAPLADVPPFAILGFLLGLPSALLAGKSLMANQSLAAIGFGLFVSYFAFLLDWFRIGIGLVFPSRIELRTFIAVFLVAAVVAWVALRLARPTRGFLCHSVHPHAAKVVFKLTGILAALCLAGILRYASRPPYPSSPPSLPGIGQGRPNIILIVMDTVRADHLSCYGYKRPTTPFIDSVAGRGVLFEDAIAPSSWTLPALASIFTGLEPHQHGASWARAVSQEPWTLAKILRAVGYETAGFSANPFYGLGAWGLSKGFNEYIDDSYSLRHSLAVTFAGQLIYRPIYRSMVRYNQFNHRNASDVNRDVLRWHARRSSRPYFLFINYMDAHRPYLPPAPYDHRFGVIPKRLLRRISGRLDEGRPKTRFSAVENQQLLTAYDNSLAYLDAQMGNLLNTLFDSPSGADTIVIVTADHGEGFGDHGTYDHGYNLYREVLQVPLIIEGPGIPAGKRIPELVGTRRLFATILDLAAGGKLPLGEASLERFWKAAPPDEEAVISELEVRSHRLPRAAQISLSTEDWHYILDSGNSASLFNAPQDPAERLNLVKTPSLMPVRNALEEKLRAQIAHSTLPWLNLGYLKPLGQPGATFIEQLAARKFPWPESGRPIGTSQALFTHATSENPKLPTLQEDENLRSLPY
jgi:arylsulfatase A-like enzyme